MRAAAVLTSGLPRHLPLAITAELQAGPLHGALILSIAHERFWASRFAAASPFHPAIAIASELGASILAIAHGRFWAYRFAATIFFKTYVDELGEAMRFMAMSMPWQYFIQAELKVSGSFFSICLQLESELERISILPFLSSLCYTEVNNLLSMVCGGWDFMTFSVC